MSNDLVPQLAGLFVLGAVHGINPAMGWLFAVALGLQQGERRAVWRAFLPLALGHGLAIGIAVAAAAALGVVVAPGQLKWLVAVALAATGIRQVLRHRHARWGGMRMSTRDLAVWSFLMASAHGAGLMAVPLVLADRPSPAAAHAEHAEHAEHLVQRAHAADAAHAVHVGAVAAPRRERASPTTSRPTPSTAGARRVVLLATLAHALGYMVVTCLVALVVYERIGLRILRTAWLNIDYAWAVALVIAGLYTLVG